MPDRSEAEEHLRVIRSLMEKATIYRAISAQAALVAGLVGLLAAAALHGCKDRVADSGKLFVLTWLGVLLVAVGTNCWFLAFDARSRGDRFVSPGMRMALRALAPSFLCALVATIVTFGSVSVVAWWMLFYGLGLLATSSFAPKSLDRLGWAFLLASWIFIGFGRQMADEHIGPFTSANLAMALTFGVFHVIYAACTWPRSHSQAGVGAKP